MDDIVIGTGVTSTGNFTTSGEICIDGVLRESQVCAAVLSVSHDGEFHGTARARHVEVFGTVSGEVLASEQVVLRSSARVSGKISAPCIVMHRGATTTADIQTLGPDPSSCAMPDQRPKA